MREIKFRAWRRKHRQMDYSRSWRTLGEFFEWHERNYPGECDLMQFTGLRDKNGKEIYEGDIIRYHVEPTTKTKVTIFREGMFATDISSLKAVRLISEVIGNIYENPELLETKDGSH